MQRRSDVPIRNEKDRKIIELLKDDSRKSYIEIGRKLGISESAVRRRIKVLSDGGTIKRFTIEIGDEDVTKAIAFITVESGTDVAKVSARLTKLDGVMTVHEITGSYDIVAMLGAPNILSINQSIDELRKIQGVINTNTMIILRSVS